ncbi:MAG TPA: alpha/beta hydrolase [Planktothrix sp.]
MSAVCDDATAAYDYLVQHEHRTSKEIIVFGESFGTGVTGELVKRRALGAVVFHSGYSSLLRAGRDYLPWLKLYPDFCFPKSYDNIATFEKPHPPLFIVHGTDDRVCSVRNAEDLYKLACEPKAIMIVPGGGHGAFGKREQFKTELCAFLKQNSL